MLPGGRAEVSVTPDPERPGVLVTARLAALADVPALVARVRRMFDLDADSVAIDAALSADPVLAPLVAAVPGIRIAGSVDGEEALFRTLIGQQISVAAARTVLGRLVADLGAGPDGARFPSAATIAERGAEVLRGPASRIATILRAADAVASGELRLDVETPAAELRERLLALPGIGPWTADYLAMRVLGNPDVLIIDRPGDPAERCGRSASPPRAAGSLAERGTALGAVAQLRDASTCGGPGPIARSALRRCGDAGSRQPA